MKQDTTKPIGYRRDYGNEVVHVKCWEAFRAKHEQTAICRAQIGSIYYPGAEKLDEPLYNKVCVVCGFSFEISNDGCRWLRLTTHADNGWQHHYPK